ncbi:MAG: hypothetical protein J7513_01725 [Solirubrobacteraceae bacterium]|nr:hypothetical protein [Solirubrobacteraceae bacterium]
MPSSSRTRLLSLAAVAITVLSGLAAAPADAARSSIRVGIGDQGKAMFDSPYYQALKLKTTRYFFPWNGMSDPYQVTLATQYVQRAQAAGVSVLFHLSTDDFTLKKAKLPSVAAYRAQVKKIVPYFRALGVHEWGVWNEANHASQPTYKNPKRAAQFFREMYQVVGSKEKIVALDILDQAAVDRYEKTFFGSLSPTYRKRAKVIGLHNYGDVNRKRTTYTSLMIKTARHYNRSAKFWFTETGGLVEFGRSFKCSTARAATNTRAVLNLAKKYKPFGVERVYYYNWTGPGCGKTRFDSGLMDRHGKPRKAYSTLKTLLKGYSR